MRPDKKTAGFRKADHIRSRIRLLQTGDQWPKQHAVVRSEPRLFARPAASIAAMSGRISMGRGLLVQRSPGMATSTCLRGSASCEPKNVRDMFERTKDDV
jgi:hypothetical protein